MRPDQREGETEAKPMATILPFVRGGPDRKRPSRDGAASATGTIVIFTGVRVEYGIPASAATSAGKGRPRRRRRNPAKDAALVV